MGYSIVKTAFVTALAGALLAGPAAAETTLRFNNFLPRTSFLFTQLLEPWAEDVSEATGGEVKIAFTTTSLGPPPTQLDMVTDGIADMAFSIAAYTPDRLKLTQIAELPFIGDSSEAVSSALWDTYETYLYKGDEFKGVKLLGFVTSVPSNLYTVKGPINSAADLTGLKLRVSGPVPGKIAEKLGAVPVGAPGAEAYQMMTAGIIDGTMFSHDGITDFKMESLIQHVTIFPKGLFNTVFYIVINETAWSKLTPEQQMQIMSVSGAAMAQKMGKTYDTYAAEALKKIEAAGATVTQASPELMEAVGEVAEPLRADWIANADAIGIDGKAAMADFLAQVDKAEAQ